MAAPLAAWMLAASAGASASAGAFTLDNVLERIRPADGRFASEYRQTRASTLLTEEVEVHGRIVFTAPDQLYRTETGAAGERRTIEIDAGTVRIEEDGEVSRYGLDQAPTLALLMDVLQAVATGDAGHLRAAYGARLAGDWNGWRIALETELPAAVARSGDAGQRDDTVRVTLAGSGDRVGSLAIDSPRRGRTRIHFTEPEDP